MKFTDKGSNFRGGGEHPFEVFAGFPVERNKTKTVETRSRKKGAGGERAVTKGCRVIV